MVEIISLLLNENIVQINPFIHNNVKAKIPARKLHYSNDDNSNDKVQFSRSEHTLSLRSSETSTPKLIKYDRFNSFNYGRKKNNSRTRALTFDERASHIADNRWAMHHHCVVDALSFNIFL